jgi:putative colanic acid biosynthesis UDP-glucose lipid carrier transferase
LLVLHDTRPRLIQHQPGPAALVRAAIDPVVAIVTLLVSTAWMEGRFDGAHLILALIVFSLMFPGTASRENAALRTLIAEVLKGWLAIVGLLLLLGWASRTLDIFDPGVLLAWTLATPIALVAAHRLAPVILQRVLAAEGRARLAVIAGANPLGQQLAQAIRADPILGIRCVGYFDDRICERLDGMEPSSKLGTLTDLAEYVKSNRVDLIFIALPMASQPRILHLLEQLHDTTASIYFAPDIFVFDLIQARVDSIGDIPVVAICETPFYGINGAIKRLSDIVLASLILMLILPMMIFIAAGVKLSSRGPALFKQRRYGLDGREIVVYKFRTMTVLEDGEVVQQATRNDKRVTRFGAFLRQYSLDELPQFINVLQGRMSVVGPRPHAVAHNEMYRKLIRRYMIRHKVKPGITGLAQVNGFRGETDDIDKMKGRIEQDLAYLRHWSLRLDLRIILKTIAVVLRRDNAY